MQFPQSLKVSAIDKLITKFNFLVTLNEFVFGFESVSGLEINKRVDYIPEGGVNDHQLLVTSPTTDNPTLTFRRGMLVHSSNAVARTASLISTSLLRNNLLRKTTMLAEAAIDARTSLEVGPALGSIQVYNRNGKLSALYVFLSLGMTSWKAEDLDASSSDVWCEEVTIAHTGLERCPLQAMGFVHDAFRAGVKATMDYDIDAKDSHSSFNLEEQLKKNRELIEKAKQRMEELKEKKKKEQEELEKKKQELEEKKKQEKEEKEKQQEKLENQKEELKNGNQT